jgi:GntR family transcriptional regulator
VVGDSTVPKYRQIADELRRRIEAGDFKATKGKLPGERDLSGSEDVSLETVRKALRVLVDEGRVEVRRGAGAFVRDFKRIHRHANKRMSADQWGAGKSIQEADVEDRKLDVVELSVTRRIGPDWVGELLGTRDVVVRDRVFVVENRRVQAAQTYFPRDAVEGSLIEDEDTGPGGAPARLRELGYDVVAYEEIVTARSATAEELLRLKLRRGATVVEITRTSVTADGRIIEVNRMVLDADAYVFHWTFTS